MQECSHLNNEADDSYNEGLEDQSRIPFVGGLIRARTESLVNMVESDQAKQAVFEDRGETISLVIRE